ncbi:helix-turn-helix domain-containing protein [Paenibacillus alginolyticus]|uniref:Helix-turn-helix domain-containing protein n=1 Tax=Paenibacillus alginolyticus TaxID=59839 RepID=A0ABT4G8G9_9BACL|nr:helix-turn-helix domain-containing protein [Paenibacillus alginolyticus]MCY9668102.1 helix-turn-helix domain-containing protein [Paenibacillus alginolyticus]MCY9692475.1 helix-turn-helix domain-containing protein [Paenibacillus alginolyticus]MEC0144267.1 helix-turn-helix domain-containing protein [Paenibacillus alginolyticus]
MKKWVKFTHKIFNSIFTPGKGMFYRKSLVLILLITSIPGLIMGFLMYWFAGGRIEEELVQLHKNQITRRAESLGVQFDHSELTMSHLAFEPLLDYRLLETDFNRKFDITRDITKTLIIMEGSMTLTTKLEFYMGGTTPIQFSPEYNLLPPDSEEWKQSETLLKQGPPVYWTLLPSRLGIREKPDLALVHKMPGGTMAPYGILIARTNRERLQDLLKTLTPYEDGEAFLMQEDGTLLASTGTGDSSALLQELRSEVLHHPVGTPSFIWNGDHNKYSVSFGKFERIGTTWIYVSAAPIDAITRPVVFLSKLVMQISCAGMLLAAALAWFASRRIYSPMARLMGLLSYGKQTSSVLMQDEFQVIEEQWQHLTRQSTALQSKLETQLPQVRQGFLYQLVQGYLFSYAEEELRERMRQYGWRVEECRYQVLFIRVLGMTQASMQGRFSLGDEGLVSFAEANIAQEMTEERFGQCQVINFHDLTVGVLLELDAQEFDGKNSLYDLGEALIQMLNGILKLQATVIVGGTCTDVKHIPWVFEEARLALNYRKWDTDNQILDVELLRGREKTPGSQYPFAVEREIIQAMRTGKLEETELQIKAFLEAMTQGGATDLDVRQGGMNLLGTLEREIMQSGLNPNELLSPINRFEQLSELRESEQILQWFVKQIIRPFMEEMENRSDYKIKKIVDQAIRFIEEHYMRDISLDECAEYCGTNAFLLSRSFKQVAGKNFIDYLTDLRMERARALLRDSEQKIFDIAEQVGYQHSYFNRLFKKFEGVTPTQYRERVRRT